MRDYLLTAVMAVLLLAGYFAVNRFGALIQNGKNLCTVKEYKKKHHISISAEDSGMYEDLSDALTAYQDSRQYVELQKDCKNSAEMLSRLNDGTLDLAVMKYYPELSEHPNLVFVRIPHKINTYTSENKTVEELSENACIIAAWNRKFISEDRDRLISMITDLLPMIK